MIRLSTPAGQALAELVVELADADRLTRGRSYQRKGYAERLDVGPGAAQLVVAGSRSDPYHVTVAVREANDNVRSAVGEDIAAAVPGAGDVGFTCDCPDWGDPCKHGVAALLQLAREVDDDPSVLLRWRGIDDVVPPPPPGTGPLIDPKSDDATLDRVNGANGAGRPDEVGTDRRSGSDSLAALDAAAERHQRSRATGAYDPDEELIADSFGRPRGRGRSWSDDGEVLDGSGVGSFTPEPTPEIPGPGDAAREIRRRFGDDRRPTAGTAETRLADLRRRLGADLVDPADVAAAEARAASRAGVVETDGPLAEFFGHHLAAAIDPPEPLDVVPLDAYDHVRIPVETTDAAPVLADALETITEHWVGR